MNSRINKIIDKYRFRLLLVFTVLFLVLPAYFRGSPFFDVVTFLSLSFVFAQSALVTSRGTLRQKIAITLVIMALLLVWFRVYISESVAMNALTFLFITGLFIYIIANLFRFINHSQRITSDVITVSIVIYLFIGMVGGCMAFLFQNIYPDAYNFPNNLENPTLADMIYYSYVTMTTLGYGDITPARGESRNLAFMIAITGQLYVAIAIAFLVGKYLAHEQIRRDKTMQKEIDDLKK